MEALGVGNKRRATVRVGLAEKREQAPALQRRATYRWRAMASRRAPNEWGGFV